MKPFLSSSGKDLNDIIGNALACLEVLNTLAKDSLEKQREKYQSDLMWNAVDELKCIISDSDNTQEELCELQDFLNDKAYN